VHYRRFPVSTALVSTSPLARELSVVLLTIAGMWPIVGTEALAAGALTRSALRWRYTAVHPNIYVPRDARRDLFTNTVAAWLWTGRRGIIAGRAAAALHGVRWIDDTVPVELIARHGRNRPGVVVRDEQIGDDEICQLGELHVTTPARTALDLARCLPREDAVAHLDALAAATGISAAEVKPLEERYRSTPGIRAARSAIASMDGGSRSPRATALRLFLIDAGLPKPRTNISLSDDQWEATVAMGWEVPRVGVDCEEDRAGLNAMQNIACQELFQRLGWFYIRVHPQHTPAFTLHRVRTALRRRQR
jgi:hypothetical protein